MGMSKILALCLGLFSGGAHGWKPRILGLFSYLFIVIIDKRIIIKHIG